MSKAHKGKKLSKETKEKISKARKKKVEINKVLYLSITEASEALNVHTDTITRWIKKGKAKEVL